VKAVVVGAGIGGLASAVSLRRAGADTLGLCLWDTTGIDDALRAYEAARLPRVQRVARDSRRIGRVMATRNPLVASTATRHALLAWDRPVRAARRLNLRQMARHASRHAFLATLPGHAAARD
jgi:2-polyprenyl-6-methoxyphenol hydroxylase-like FAD-dependent oxidoreductase